MMTTIIVVVVFVDLLAFFGQARTTRVRYASVLQILRLGLSQVLKYNTTTGNASAGIQTIRHIFNLQYISKIVSIFVGFIINRILCYIVNVLVIVAFPVECV